MNVDQLDSQILSDDQIKQELQKLYGGNNSKNQLDFEAVKESFYRIFRVDQTFDEDLWILFKLADSGARFSDDEKDDDQLGKKEFTNFIKKIPRGETNKHKMFATLFFRMIDDNDSGNINSAEFKDFWNAINPKNETPLGNANGKIKNDKWKEYISVFGDDIVCKKLYDIIAGEDKAKGLKLDRFVEWYVSLC